MPERTQCLVTVVTKTQGVPKLVIQLLYGSGLSLSEALRLRVQDPKFETRQVWACDGKGHEDRITVLPKTLLGSLQEHMAHE